MRTLGVELSQRRYPIHIGPDLLSEIEILSGIGARRRFIVTDDCVAGLYLPRVRTLLGIGAEDCFILPAGESSKSWASAERVLDAMLERMLPRDAVVVALGGGVVGDLAGFCASIYQRGIGFIQIPTTLLAQVDSSVGGKTGINHPRGKNLIGAFHQPLAVIADIATLTTLPRRELTAGAAEIIKTALLGDAGFFFWLETHLDAIMRRDPEALMQAIETCCAIKARIVASDECENGVRALLNLGHTFGHAIENFAGYGALLHGEAVGIGLCMAADLSTRIGLLDAAARDRCFALVKLAGCPIRAPIGMTPEIFLELMARDKKVVGGQLRLILLTAIGDALITADYDPARLYETLMAFCEAPVARNRLAMGSTARL